MRPTLAVAVATGCVGALAAQTTWTTHGAPVPPRVVGAAAAATPGATAVVLPAGGYDVHFAADAAGKPESLRFVVVDGDVVGLAVERAAPVAATAIAAHDPAWSQGPGTCTIAAPERRDYRLVVTFDAAAGDCGLIARRRDDDNLYRLDWHRDRGELRLARRVGGSRLELARAPLPPLSPGPHTLALQVHGFRLAAWFDDAQMLTELDGALTAGDFGVAWSGEGPPFTRFVVEPVAAPRGSAALVRRDGAASYFASAVVSAGHRHVLEIGLDRPHALLPRDVDGVEPWLLQPPAAPTCLLADWRDSLGPGGIGELGPGGRLGAELRWPRLPGLALQCGLVRALLVTGGGEAVVGATPAVPLRF
ncbi:MAG: hypothetical protein IT455_07545 [Planctomycetes bacterium]|nr:hypothetical protein [Planctomycetota bacterium]